MDTHSTSPARLVLFVHPRFAISSISGRSCAPESLAAHAHKETTCREGCRQSRMLREQEPTADSNPRRGEKTNRIRSSVDFHPSRLRRRNKVDTRLQDSWCARHLRSKLRVN